jgi:nucleoside-diphosphate-sugar epimerase
MLHTILGINGPIGKGLATELKNRGQQVRGISRRPFHGDWEYVTADVLNLQQLTAATEGSDVIYLCVGLKYDINIWSRDWQTVMSNCINASLANNAKLVFIDNVYMYGLVEGEMTETTPSKPNSKKGVVRMHIADMLLDAFANKGLKGCIGRAADFYGPDCANSFVNMLVFEKFAKQKSANWLGKDDVVHSFTFTNDIFKSLATLGMDDRSNGQIWHLPTKENPLTGKQMIALAAQEMGVPAKHSNLGNFMVWVGGLFNPLVKESKEMMYQNNNPYIFDSSKYQHTFGDVIPTTYQEGVKATAKFYKS